ncbi:hypothetical protein ABIB73_004574 [Bradyrhizobium sp. F1.4.3]|uniref:hypothetical protein n=1 Tax=Bradyrhizobium sp. F1.4.3 TaxID=3156356 RepID=UPI0033910FA1
MPKDLYFWLAVIAVIFLVAVLAIWRWAKNVSVAIGPVRIETSDRDAAAAAPDPVVVAKQAEIDGTVGRIIGKAGEAGALPHGPTSVGEGMKVGKGASINEITGVSVTPRK